MRRPRRPPAPPPRSGEEPAGNSVGCCLRSIPWVHTLCSGLIIAALVIFITKSSLAFASVKALLVDLKVVGPVVKTASTLSSAALATGAAVTCMILLLAVIATIASMSGKARRYKVRHGMAKRESRARGWGWRWWEWGGRAERWGRTEGPCGGAEWRPAAGTRWALPRGR
jgi:hypothetical protein